MTESDGYTAYHPRWLRPRVSTYWWLTRRSYLVFILRELSSVFVAWFVVYLLFLIRSVGRGDASYRHFLVLSANPIVVVLNLVSLIFLVFHAITWFNLAPQAIVVHVGKNEVPPVLIAASNYAAWAVTSGVLAWFILGR
jgi:fumarate reductase subunit C